MAQKQSPEYEAIKLALAENTDPTTAALALTKPVQEAFQADSDLEGPLRKLWSSVFSMAAETPYNSQSPLIDILQAVQKQKIGETEDGSDVEIWGSKQKVWKDMPIFGAQAREEWNRAPRSGSNNDFSPKEWQNLNAFVAQLTSISSRIPAFDFSLYAIWTMRSVFEEIQAQDDVGAAKMWFIYAGETLERLSHESKSFGGKIAKEGSKYNGKDWRGFNAERLEIWKKGIQ